MGRHPGGYGGGGYDDFRDMAPWEYERLMQDEAAKRDYIHRMQMMGYGSGGAGGFMPVSTTAAAQQLPPRPDMKLLLLEDMQ